MKQRILTFWCMLACMLLTPALGLADEPAIVDAKLDGYKGVAVPDRAEPVTWLLLIFLILLSMAVLFKNARRTHLD